MTTRDTHGIVDLLAEIRGTLEAAGIDGAVTDAQLIVAHVLSVSRGRVQALELLGSRVDATSAERAREIAQDRARRIPLQHLTGRAPFRSLELSVGPGVFVPRPETEIVAQFAIDALRAAAEPRAVDLCTGSGAIALAIAAEVPAARVWAVERSPLARAWAERNIDEWGDGRVTLLDGDVRELHTIGGLAALRGGLDVVVSNPPYVPEGMIPRDPEVRDHDPDLALFGGPDGLDIVRAISGQARDLVRPGGTLVLEHAEMQGEAIRHLLTGDGWHRAETHPDLTGRDRVTVAVAP